MKNQETRLLDDLRRIVSKESPDGPKVWIDGRDVSGYCNGAIGNFHHQVDQFGRQEMTLELKFDVSFNVNLFDNKTHRIEFRPGHNFSSPIYSFDALCVRASVNYNMGMAAERLFRFSSVGPLTTTSHDPGKEFTVSVE